MSTTKEVINEFEIKDNEMILETNRLNSYKDWPLMDGKCTKENMSAYGFYHCPNDGKDLVRCFCCFKELDGWDQSDDPSIEHKRNNDCYFANLGKPQSKLTLFEWFKLIEEREINKVTKTYQRLQDLMNDVSKQVGLIDNNKII